MENELNESPLLRKLKRQSSEAGSAEPPDGYFESFAARLRDQLADESLRTETPYLHSLPRHTPEVDEAYFLALPDRLTDAAILSEAPLLSQIPRLHPQVPSGYFEHLPAHLLAQVAPAQPAAKIRRLGQPAVRYAIAASLGLLLAASAWFWLSPPVAPQQPIAANRPAAATPALAPIAPATAEQSGNSPVVPNVSAPANSRQAAAASTNEALRALSREELITVVSDYTSAGEVEDVIGEEALASLTDATDMIQAFSPDDLGDLLDGLSMDDLL